MALDRLQLTKAWCELVDCWVYFGAPKMRETRSSDAGSSFFWHRDLEFVAHHESLRLGGRPAYARDLRRFIERARAYFSEPICASASSGYVVGKPETQTAGLWSDWENTRFALRALADEGVESTIALHPTGDRAWLALMLAALDRLDLAEPHAGAVTEGRDRIWMDWLARGRNRAELANALEPGRYMPQKGSVDALRAALLGDWQGVLAAVPANAEDSPQVSRRWGPNRILAKLARLHLGDVESRADLRSKAEDFLALTGPFGAERPSPWSLSITSVLPYAELYRSTFRPSLSPAALLSSIAKLASFKVSVPDHLSVPPELVAALDALDEWLRPLPDDAMVARASEDTFVARS